MIRNAKVLLLTVVALPALSFASGCSAQEKYSPDQYAVRVKTSMGDMLLKLFNETPIHRDNFIKLVDEGFYEGIAFHRIIRDFMIQGGDPSTRAAKGDAASSQDDVGYTLPAEINPQLFHVKGALAAARTGDNVNPERRSSGSQFYIVEGKVYSPEEMVQFQERLSNQLRFQAASRVVQDYYERELKDRKDLSQDEMRRLVDSVGNRAVAAAPAFEYPADVVEKYTSIGGTPHLDQQYTVFGQLVDGMDVLERISQVQTGAMDRPVEPVLILKMEVVNRPKASN